MHMNKETLISDKPFCFNVSDCANVVLCCQYELIIQNPLRFVIETRRWMQLDNLIVFHSQVVTSSLEVCHLHTNNSKGVDSSEWYSIHDSCFRFNPVAINMQNTILEPHFSCLWNSLKYGPCASNMYNLTAITFNAKHQYYLICYLNACPVPQ